MEDTSVEGICNLNPSTSIVDSLLYTVFLSPLMYVL